MPRAIKPLVYVAGPITSDPWGCVRSSMRAFVWLRRIGAVPILPQLSILAEMVHPQGYEAWMEHDLDLIDHCDALLRLPGESPGADREVAHAEGLGRLLVAHMDRPGDVELLVEWCAAWPLDAADQRRRDLEG